MKITTQVLAVVAAVAIVAGTGAVPKAFARDGGDSGDQGEVRVEAQTNLGGSDTKVESETEGSSSDTGDARLESESEASSSGSETSDKGREERSSAKQEVRDASSTEAEDSDTGEEHRSKVAEFVQSLLETSRHSGGIGEEVRVVAEEQASSTDKVAEAIDHVNGRNPIVVFLIGPSRDNLEAIKEEMASTSERIAKLKELLPALSASDQAKIETEIGSVEAEQARLGSFVSANDSKFSLFGWFVRFIK